MKPPPLILGATLLFWGWQSGLEIQGVAMALVLEAPRWIKVRWDFSEEDFSRIWLFCVLLFFATALYAFTANEGPSQFRSLFQDPTLSAQRRAGMASARTAASLFRWLPMVFFLFVAGQAYSARGGVPVETVSLLLRWRWKRTRKPGDPAVSGQVVNVGYIYFGLCLFAASVHTNEDTSFFWGLCALLGWALWPYRSRRFGPVVWFACLAVAVSAGYFGQRELAHLQNYLGRLTLSLGGLARGRYDPAQSRVDFGKIGRNKTSGQIVVRLEARQGAAPPLLRETSYRRFNGQTWFADLREMDYVTVLEEPPNSGTYNLLRGRTNTLRVNIGCYLEGGTALMPLPSGVGRLENLSANILARNPLGGVLNQGPAVVVFDALYSPGATIDSLPDTNLDLAVPVRERPALDAVISQLDLEDQDARAAVGALNKFFAEKFSYSTYEEPLRPARDNPTYLSRFLLRSRRGHCEYFATAGVLLLRRLQIPARYAVGFTVHEGAGDKFVVRQRDAHAWCLVWDESRNTWRDIDFTPSSWVETEALSRGWWRSVSDFWSQVRFEISKFRWGQTRLRQYLLLGVAPILAVLLLQILLRSRRRHRADQGKDKLSPAARPGSDSEFYRLETALARRGFTRSRDEPLSVWVSRLTSHAGTSGLEDALPELLRLHYRYRFDPQGLGPEDREALRSKVTDSLQRLRTAPARGRGRS